MATVLSDGPVTPNNPASTAPASAPVNQMPSPAPAPVRQESLRKPLFFNLKLFLVFFPIVFLLLTAGLILSLRQNNNQPGQQSTPSPAPNATNNPSAILASNQPTFTTEPLTITQRWKTWSDPNAFFVKYPPLTQINHLNELTTLQRKSSAGFYQISFCRNCTRLACEGDCQKSSDITVTVGQTSKPQKQIWPSKKGYYTFGVSALYPNKYKQETLVILAEYENEALLTEINLVLSTFEWRDKATAAPTSEPSFKPTSTPDYY